MGSRTFRILDQGEEQSADRRMMTFAGLTYDSNPEPPKFDIVEVDEVDPSEEIDVDSLDDESRHYFIAGRITQRIMSNSAVVISGSVLESDVVGENSDFMLTSEGGVSNVTLHEPDLIDD